MLIVKDIMKFDFFIYTNIKSKDIAILTIFSEYLDVKIIINIFKDTIIIYSLNF